MSDYIIISEGGTGVQGATGATGEQAYNDYTATPKVRDILSKGVFADIRAFAANGEKFDGSSDNTVTMRTWLQWSEDNGTDLIAPPLIYKLTGTCEFLFSQPRVIIMTGATILNHTTTIDPLLHIRSSCILFAPKIINQPGVNPSPTAIWGEGTYFNSPLLVSNLYGADTSLVGAAFNNVIVHNLEIEKSIHGASAICVLGDGGGVELNNCVVDAAATDETDTFFSAFNVQSNGDSIRLRRVKMNNCFVKNLAGEAIPYYLSGNRALSATNCGADTAKFGVVAHVGDNGTTTIGDAQLEFIGGEFTNISGYFVQVIGHKAVDKSDKKITNFLFDGLRMIGAAGATSAVPLRVVSSAGGLRFHNSYIKDVNCGCYITDCDSAEISGNTLENVLTSAFAYGGIGFALADKANYNRIFGNKFISTDKEAIQIIGSSGNLIDGLNQFLDVYRTGATTVSHAAISLATNSLDNSIGKNVFGYTGQVTTPYKWVSIKDNTCNLTKIDGNDFYHCASGVSVYNHTTASNFVINTLIRGNIAKSTDGLFSGASPLIDIRAGVRTWLHDGAPTVGKFALGDETIRVNTAAAGYRGQVCVTAGTPGVWKGAGLIQA